MNHNQSPADVDYRSIVLVGAPGTGKGTQGKALGALPGFCFISMGAVLRSLETDPELGRSVRDYLRAGELVPSELVVSIWKKELAKLADSGLNPQEHLLLLDGIPRSVEQAEALQPFLNVQRLVHLACKDERLLMERIRQRQDQRADDSDREVTRHRFQIYREQTAPLLGWYPAQKIATVDAAGSPLEVLRQIVEVLLAAGADQDKASSKNQSLSH